MRGLRARPPAAAAQNSAARAGVVATGVPGRRAILDNIRDLLGSCGRGPQLAHIMAGGAADAAASAGPQTGRVQLCHGQPAAVRKDERMNNTGT